MRWPRKLTKFSRTTYFGKTASAAGQIEAAVRIRQPSTNLFETLEISVTPEQLESFILLSKRHYFDTIPIQEATIIGKYFADESRLATKM